MLDLFSYLPAWCFLRIQIFWPKLFIKVYLWESNSNSPQIYSPDAVIAIMSLLIGRKHVANRLIKR